MGEPTRRTVGAGLLATGATLAARAPVRAAPPARTDARSATPFDAPAGFPAAVTAIWTGAHSHWLQPWRTMLATRSLDAFADGLGIQNNDQDHPDSVAMFARAGFRHIRIGVAWSFVSFDDPRTIPDAEPVRSTQRMIAAARRAGMRPLVLLQAFSQAPCPHRTLLVPLVADAAAGDRTMRLGDGRERLVPGRSGPTAWWTRGGSVFVPTFIDRAEIMCPVFFTAIDGDGVAHLSKPLPVAIPSGSRLIVDTLAFAPFGTPGTAGYRRTLAGWGDYVGATARFMTAALGTGGAADRGFDLEVWNETTFGSEFLDANNYHVPPVAAASTTDAMPTVMVDLVRETSDALARDPDLFRGVALANGFASVSPMPAASRQPPSVVALTKHPYPSPQSFPAADNKTGGLDAHGHPTGFVPRYTMFAHEYFSTAISPFTLARDIATTPNEFGDILHGQDARTVGGTARPVGVWMTEIGTATDAVGVREPSTRMRLLAKGTLRALFFNIGIGVERLYIFRGVGDPGFFALVPSDAPLTPTLPLLALRRALDAMRGTSRDGDPGPLRRFDHAFAFAGTPPPPLWDGDGTANCPPFRTGDDLVLVPIAVSPKRTAFVAWFTGLDMRKSMPSTAVTLRIGGLGRRIAGVRCYDPIADRDRRSHGTVGADGALAIDTTLDDVPAILLVDEA